MPSCRADALSAADYRALATLAESVTPRLSVRSVMQGELSAELLEPLTLTHRKLLLDWQSARGYRAAALLMVIAVFAFGIVRLVIGLIGGRPVGFLTVMLVAVLGAGWVVCVAPVRARAAQRALDMLKARHPH